LNAHNLQLSDLFIKISGFESDLDKLDLFLSSQNKKSDKFKELAKITSALIDDIKFKNKEVQELSKQVKQNISLLENQTSDLSDNNIAALQDFGKGLFKSLMSNIKDYTTDIGNQLYKNIDISNNISEDIKASINNIKYYQLFEKIIEEIIEKLNGINQILRNKNILNVNEDGVSDLNLLKEKYTMQSERDIHDQILNKEKELGIKSKKEEEDQGDLELF
jgi:ABC-type transporter Mla subunit MlaD